jgi:acyl carrier protein
MTNIEKQVIKIISINLNIPEDQINRQTDLVKDLDADSIDSANIINTIKGQTDIDIAMQDAMSLITVEDIIHYIEKRS